jgi:signal transduction histidine kinase/ActR/RegA family two-component response regulator
MRVTEPSTTPTSNQDGFEAALRRAPVVLFTQDHELRYTWVHNAVFDTPEGIVGKTDADLFPRSTAVQLTRIKQAVLDTGQGRRTEIRVEIPTGPRHYDLTVEPIHDERGGISGIACAAVDITELIDAKRQLFETNQRLQALMQAVPVGISFSDDPSCRRITGNPAVMDQFAAAPDENLSASAPDPALRGRRARFFRDGREVSDWDLPLQRAVTTNEPVPPMELEVLLPNGRRWYADASGAPVRDGDGNVIAGLAVTIDITDRKRVETALKDAERRKDEFLATLAHELRNPLAPIRNAVDAFKALGVADPALVRARDVIDRQVDVMARLLDDLLDVARVQRGKLKLREQTIELASVLASAVETSRPLIDAARHELVIQLPPDPVVLHGDAVRLAQVFANLLNNAAKYTPRGGCIRLTAKLAGSSVVVTVADDGIGIPSDMLPRLFEIFSQAQPALERSQGGLGVGLSLVRGLVELHGGTIEARSAGPDRGAEFVVRLPVSAMMPDNVATAAVGNAEMGLASKSRLLIVDDVPDSADSLAMLLELMGHEVHTAYEAERAMALAATLRPDVMLIDIGMPQVNGYELCRQLRRQPWGGEVCLVAVTGWAQEEDKLRASAAGFDRHMTKPVDADALESLLATLATARKRGPGA